MSKLGVALVSPHVHAQRKQLKFLEPAGPCRSAEGGGRLKEGPGVNEEDKQCTAFDIVMELGQELSTHALDTRS